ncbi:hypothetical protein CCH79_00012685 [Gambusia affinis]|uniref:Uncharacterized protein n=1 Tax=Gambusia affinis TaxID=33528 RepID=A0A315V031_GAMAF|nr:hypothetical protein CCH79_00012685 [Gambusia affinis]
MQLCRAASRRPGGKAFTDCCRRTTSSTFTHRTLRPPADCFSRLFLLREQNRVKEIHPTRSKQLGCTRNPRDPLGRSGSASTVPSTRSSAAAAFSRQSRPSSASGNGRRRLGVQINTDSE